MMNGVDPLPYYFYFDGFESRERKLGGILDKDDFLRLLITELQYQNPLEPLDNKDFIAQMAQFSSLEQMSNISQSIDRFLETEMNAMRLNAISMIGRNAVVRDDTIILSDGSAERIDFQIDEPANVIITIYDFEGNAVRRENLGTLDPGLHSFVWDGRNDDGELMQDGEYKYEISCLTDEGEEKIGGLIAGVVEAVQFDEDGIYIVIDGRRYPLSSLVEIS